MSQWEIRVSSGADSYAENWNSPNLTPKGFDVKGTWWRVYFSLSPKTALSFSIFGWIT